MANRLPTPGGDDNNWGTILNDFLEVSLNSDGTLNSSAVSASGAEMASNKNQPSGYAGLNSSGFVPVALLPANIPLSDLAVTGTPNNVKFLRGDGTWATPAGGVNLDGTATDIQPDTITGSAVAGSTGLASDAGHQHPLVAHDHTTTNKGGQIPVGGLSASGTPSSTTFLRGDNSWIAPPTASNATNLAPGLVQLAGSLGGSATSPTVVTNANLTGDVTSVGNATTLTSSSNVESVISANSTVTSKAPTASPTFTGKVTTPQLQVTTGSGTANQVLTSDVSGNATWVTPAAGVALDSTASDIQPIGSQSAGSNSQAARADHVHPSTGLLLAANNLSDAGLNAGTSRANLHVPALTPVAAVSVGTNVSGTYSANSFAPSITTLDSYTIANNDLILLTAQTSAVQNGLWQVPSAGGLPGTWTRPAEFASGLNIKGRSVAVLNGTNYANTIWVLNAPTGGVVIDSGSQTWSATTITASLANESVIRSSAAVNQFNAANGNLAMGNGTSNFRITNMANGIGPQDAVTMDQLGIIPNGTGGSTGSISDAVYGDGSDGSPTFDGTTVVLGVTPGFSVYTMNRDWFLASPTINNGIFIQTNGFRLFVNGTLTTVGSASIAGGSLFSQGSGVSQTSGGSSAPAGSIAGTLAGGGSSATGAAGTATSAATNSLGGAGGNGGSGSSGAGATAGTKTAPGASSGSIRALPWATLGGFLSAGATTFVAVNGGTGGAGGTGGGSSSNVAGGGGAGGAVVVAAIQYINLTGSSPALLIEALGGNGGAAIGTNAGGGGGGGGGVVIFISKNLGFATVSVTGGTGGAKTGSGTAGTAGGNGTAVLIQN